ncbi:MAG TPA: hypothetical protein DD645_02150 [Olsenella sp.]|nr:hypothetical protein [Olsenella sp.]
MMSRRAFLAVAGALLLGGCSGGEKDAGSAADAPTLRDGAGAGEDTEEVGTMDELLMTVTCGDAVVTYELNDSPAASALLAQLPLTLEVENFSNNEKVFYPPAELDVTDTPLAETGAAGTLAYYEPWGDVVMFYGPFSRNGSLYELGRAVAGEERLAGLSGTIEVALVE